MAAWFLRGVDVMVRKAQPQRERKRVQPSEPAVSGNAALKKIASRAQAREANRTRAFFRQSRQPRTMSEVSLSPTAVLAFLGFDLLEGSAEFGDNLPVILVQPLRACHLRAKPVE